jgi:hypothetical protein
MHADLTQDRARVERTGRHGIGNPDNLWLRWRSDAKCYFFEASGGPKTQRTGYPDDRPSPIAAMGPDGSRQVDSTSGWRLSFRRSPWPRGGVGRNTARREEQNGPRVASHWRVRSHNAGERRGAGRGCKDLRQKQAMLPYRAKPAERLHAPCIAWRFLQDGARSDCD